MIHWAFMGSAKTELNPSLWEQLQKKEHLGYLKLPFRDQNWSLSKKFADEMAQKVDCLVVLGMGGSSLGGKLLSTVLSCNEKKLLFLMNSDPSHFSHVISELKKYPKEKIGYLLISKSGGTLEVSALMSALSSTKESHFSDTKNIWVITEEKKSPLYDWAKEKAVNLLGHPQDVGGRFSVLSPVGLVPAAFVGADLAKLREGAQQAFESKASLLNFVEVAHNAFLDGKRMSVFWSYCERLDLFLPWLQQLWAESLGKKENLLASVPVLSYGATDQHSVLQQYLESENDKNFFFLRDRSQKKSGPILKAGSGLGDSYIDGVSLGELIAAQSMGTQKALAAEGYECHSIELDMLDETHLGELIMSFELIIGLLGEKLEIDAYNQPSVEKGKKITMQMLTSGETV